jgi:hypothetical protein
MVTQRERQAADAIADNENLSCQKFLLRITRFMPCAVVPVPRLSRQRPRDRRRKV